MARPFNLVPERRLDFARTIFKDACDHAFSGYRGFEGVDYDIASSTVNRLELRFGGYVIASAGNKQSLEKCQVVHSRMMDYLRDSDSQPLELTDSMKKWALLKGLERSIGLALQKLILRRSFDGRCELCPD